jgi:competence protein ComGC
MKTATIKPASTMFTSSRKKPETATDPVQDQAPETAPETSPTVDAGMAALGGITYPDVESEVDDDDAPQVVGAEPKPDAEPAPERMTKAAFRVVFKTVFKVVSVLPMVNIPELAVQADEVEHADTAADASFDIIETYFPSFFDHDHGMFAKVATVASFAIMKGMIVSAVLKARQAQAIADQNAQRQQRNNPQPAPQAQTAAPQGQVPAGYELVPMVEWAA